MVAQCLYGSTVQSGAPDWFTYTESELATFLPSVFGFVTYGLLGLPTGPQSTADFCAAEPVGDLPTAADYAKLAFPPLALISGTYARFGNQVRQNKFAELCACNGAPGGPCTVRGPFTVTTANTDVSGGPWTASDRYVHASLVGGNTPPAGQYNLSVHAFGFTPAAQHIKYRIYINGSGRVVANVDTALAVTEVFLGGDILAGETFQLVMNTDTASVPHQVTLSFTNRSDQSPCTSAPLDPNPPPPITLPGGFPGAPTPPTCGSTQDVCNTLQTVLDKLSIIDLELTDIRSQNTPFSYRLGTAVTGLTGHGSISVSAALGCVVTLTTVPSGWGSTAETPRRLIPTACNIQGASAEGYSDWQQVHYEHQVVMWGHPWATSIQYNFRNGFVGTITPLLADRAI